MKKEQKEKIVAAAKKVADADGRYVVQKDAKVNVAPDTYWVQAWIKVPLGAAKL